MNFSDASVDRPYPMYSPAFLARARERQRAKDAEESAKRELAVIEELKRKAAETEARLAHIAALREELESRNALAVVAEERQRSMLAAEYRKDGQLRPSIRQILAEVALQTGFTVDEIKSARRAKALCMARHFVFWRAKTETLLSLPEIGRRVGHRDHTTVLHGIRRFDAALAAGEPWAVSLKNGGAL